MDQLKNLFAYIFGVNKYAIDRHLKESGDTVSSLHVLQGNKTPFSRELN